MKDLNEYVSEALNKPDAAYKNIVEIVRDLVKKDPDCWDPRDWIDEMLKDYAHGYLDEDELEQKIDEIADEIKVMDNDIIDEFKAILKHKKEFDSLLLAFKDWEHPIAKYMVALMEEVKKKFK